MLFQISQNRQASDRQRSRAAVTLAEVLIAMGIMTLGLLGVASIFPVGGFYMQSGDIADRAGAVAQAALDDAIIRGHLDPENWVALNIGGAVGGPQSQGVAGPSSGELRRMTGMLRDTFREVSRREAAGGPTTFGPVSSAAFSNEFHGAAYVIDPLGMAAAMTNENQMNIWQRVIGAAPNSEPLRRFPASAALDNNNAAEWNSWRTAGPTWPVRRVTTTIDPAQITNSGTLTHQLQLPVARAFFAADNDLALSQPASGDDPVLSRWETWRDSNGVFASARQPRGDYSWIISVSPGSSEARDSLMNAPDAYPVEVSVVVFHKRVLGFGYEGSLEAERLVNARVVSTATSGGELLLDRRSADSADASPFEDLKPGQFVMVTGPHPQSTLAKPLYVLRWYRVLNITDSGRPVLPGFTTSNAEQLDRENRVLVSLRGPDWPWQATGDLTDANELSNDLRVAIVPGAVAVHTKTMRLESGSQWSID